MKVEEKLDQIKESLLAKQALLVEERKLLTNVGGIINKPEPSRISFKGYRIKKLVKLINDFLEGSFDSLQKDALEKITMHLAENTKNTAAQEIAELAANKTKDQAERIQLPGGERLE